MRLPSSIHSCRRMERGNVSIKFTLPESLTTWRFMGLAHDEDMNNGFLSDDIVAQKDFDGAA